MSNKTSTSYKISRHHELEKQELRDFYCKEMIRMIEAGLPVMHLDADAMTGIGIFDYRDNYPDNIIECGVSEANMMSVACGMSQVGRVPFTHSLASFASRRLYDQLYISGAYAKSNVKVVSTDSGIAAGYNGGTHAPIEDLALMRAIPGLTVVEPTDSVMLLDLMKTAVETYGMFYIRLRRKEAVKIYDEGSEFPIPGCCLVREGKDITVFTSGFLVALMLEIADDLEKENISIKLIDLYCLKPLDEKAIIEHSRDTGAVVTVENHNKIAGMGSAIAAVLGEHTPLPMKRVGIEDSFLFSASPEWLRNTYGLSNQTIIKAIKETIARKSQRIEVSG